jgi:hypothetical protein
MSDPHSSLKREFEIFESNRLEWSRKYEGKYAVICNGDVLGFFDNYAEALQAGIAKFSVKAEFLVQQVCEEEPVFVIY